MKPCPPAAQVHFEASSCKMAKTACAYLCLANYLFSTKIVNSRYSVCYKEGNFFATVMRVIARRHHVAGPAKSHEYRALLLYAPNLTAGQAVMRAFAQSVACPADASRKAALSTSFYALFRPPLPTEECEAQAACLSKPSCSEHLLGAILTVIKTCLDGSHLMYSQPTDYLFSISLTKTCHVSTSQVCQISAYCICLLCTRQCSYNQKQLDRQK